MPPEDNPADDVQPDRAEYVASMIDTWQHSTDPDAHRHAANFLAQEFIAQTLTRGGVDAKYGVVTVEKGTLHPGEPVFLLRATDDLAVETIHHYLFRCTMRNCKRDHTRGISKAMDAVKKWQLDHPELVKLPD